MKEFDVLKKHDFKFNKKFGQNFIFDKNLLKAIVNDAQIDKNTNVLEIGCGSGTLTGEIAFVAKKVVGFEIDTNLKDVLSETLEEYDNVEIVYKDILKTSISEIENKFDGDYVIIANLPYYITTPIIFKFLEESTRLKSLVIMVQLEVARRLCAKENTEDYGSITVALNSCADVNLVRIVKRNMFTPAPNVDSAIVKIDFNEKYQINNKKILEKVIRSAFAMRRKTLSNNLKSSFAFDACEIERLFKQNNLKNDVRGEALSVKQFVDLANSIATLVEER